MKSDKLLRIIFEELQVKLKRTPTVQEVQTEFRKKYETKPIK